LNLQQQDLGLIGSVQLAAPPVAYIVMLANIGGIFVVQLDHVC
jgi:hypothetical protein